MKPTARTGSILLLAAAATLAAACKDRVSSQPGGDSASSQTFEDAMRVACDAPNSADLPPASGGEANRAMLLAAWLDRRVQNREVRQLMGGAGAETPDGKLAALEAGARRAGIERCALADLWRTPPPAESRPPAED